MKNEISDVTVLLLIVWCVYKLILVAKYMSRCLMLKERNSYLTDKARDRSLFFNIISLLSWPLWWQFHFYFVIGIVTNPLICNIMRCFTNKSWPKLPGKLLVKKFDYPSWILFVLECLMNRFILKKTTHLTDLRYWKEGKRVLQGVFCIGRLLLFYSAKTSISI